MPKNALIICLLLLVCFSAKAQYKGGSGDGYAMDEISNIALGDRELQSMDHSLSLYPNPAKITGRVSLIISGSQTPIYELSIYNIHGSEVYKVSIKNGAILNINLDTKHFSQGVYMVKIAGTNGKTTQRKLVIL